jgi:ABC-type multidrug transport system fused ATPase/permease subunit
MENIYFGNTKAYEEIIEDRTHEELLAIAGHYTRMWKMQAGGFLLEKEDKDK